MRRLHVDYGEYLIRLENSGKAVFRGNKTAMACRRFTESKSLPSFIFPRPSRIAPRPSRAAKRRGTAGERQFFKCFFHTGNDGRPPFPVRTSRTHDKGRGKAPNKRKGRSSPMYERTGRYGPILSAQPAIRRPNRFFAFMPSVSAMLKAHPTWSCMPTLAL